MARIACLLVPDIALAALLRTDPELAGLPLVITAASASDAEGPRAIVLACTPAAREAGVVAGHTASQARAICPRVQVRRAASLQIRAAEEALADVGEAVSPRVELTRAGTDGADACVWVDVDGLSRLYANERQLATELWARATKVGLEARVAIASSKAIARLVARVREGVTVVPEGGERALLAPLPIAALEPSERVATTLARWGIRSIGALAALPAEKVALRLGDEGARLMAAARALPPDALDDPLVPTPKPTTIDELAELEYGVESLEPLAFVMRGLLDRVVARARVRSMACGNFGVVLELEPRGEDRREIAVAAPTRDVGTLLMLARASLEKRPPGAGVKGVRIAATARAVRAQQLSFFAPAGPAPERLASTLARLQAMVGAARVGAPVVVDTHRVGGSSFEVTALATETDRRTGDRGRATGNWNGTGSGRRETGNGKCSEASALAVHAFRPERRAEVFFERERMSFLRAEGMAGRVIEFGGPWRVTADWWTAARYGRDYYDVELGDGGIYRIYRDHGSGEWFVDARYE